MDRFWRKVDTTGGPDACWPWLASKQRAGYGHLYYRGRVTRANRVAWMLERGPIPDGIHVLHRCDSPGCVNPAHLFLGTHADNMADRSAKGRASRRGNPRLTADQVAAIRHRLTLGARGIDLAAEYGVHPATIKRIKARRAWAQEAA